jgi:tetratricopeptide (TPR) repeat protein
MGASGMKRALCATWLLAACSADPATWAAYQSAGEAALASARYPRARQLLVRASREAERLGSEQQVQTLLASGRLERELGRPLEAEADFQAAEARLDATGEGETLERAWLEAERGWLALDRRAPEAAEAHFRSATATAERAGGHRHPYVGWASLGLAEALLVRRQLAPANEAAERALEILRGDALRPGVTVGIVRALTLRASLRRLHRDPDGARLDLHEAIRFGHLELTVDHPAIGDALLELARVELTAGDGESARRAADRAEEIHRQHFPEGHPSRVAAESLLERCRDESR